MDEPIRIYLLRKQPQVLVNGVQPAFTPQALKLLIYLAETGETEYAREELIRLICGTPLAREAFRKKVIYPLRQRIPDAPLEPGPGDVLYFARDRVWVDSHAFAEKARELLHAQPIFHKREYVAAQAALALYEAPFLQEYHPKSAELVDDTRFRSWQQSRQRDLAALYARLLDQVIAFCLKQQRYWADAQGYAEQWRHSLHPSAKPLQYLLWLAARQGSDMLNLYLAELRAREAAGELPLGPSWVEWNRLLKQGKPLPLSRLLPQADSSPEDRLDTLAGEPIDRQDVLEQVLTLLISPLQEPVFAVTGPPGVGKTELARQAAQALLERKPACTIVPLELTAQLDLEQLCNRILDALGRQDLFTLDYAQKRQRLKQLLHTPDLVIIVDEGHTTHLANANTVEVVLALFSGARVMLVARDLPRFEHYVLELHGLDQAQTRNFLISRVAWLTDVEETTFHDLADLTGGLPLLLHIIAGGLKKELGRLHSLVAYLQDHDLFPGMQRDVYVIYDGVLAWLWQYLDSKDRDLLYALSLFAPGEGADSLDLSAVLATAIPKAHLPQKLQRLVDLRLVQRVDTSASEGRYGLHPIIRDFVRRRSQQPRRPYAQLIEQAYIRYLLDFIASSHDQAQRLDERQQSLFRMFELVLFGTEHVWAQRPAVEALNRIFPYFEMRGLHSTASRLFTQALARGDFDSVTTHIQLLRNAAKIASIRADDGQALRLYEAALMLAQKASATRQYASLYHGIGALHMEKGRFRDAIRNFAAAEAWVDPVNQTPLLYAIWSNLGVSAFRQGRFDLARQYYQRVVDHLGDDGTNQPPHLQTIAQHVQTALGLTYTELGDYEAALRHFQHSMTLARLLNYPQLLGYLYLSMGYTYCCRREYSAADDCLRQADMIADQIQHAALRTQVTFNQGMLASRRFLHAQALQLHRTALIEAEDNALTWVKPQILISLGKVYLRSEQFDSAKQSFTDLLRLDVAPVYVAQALYGAALSIMLKTHIIGNNRVETTLESICPLLEALPTTSLPLHDLIDCLEWTHAVFQRDLDHLPQLARYRIAEALCIGLSDADLTEK